MSANRHLVFGFQNSGKTTYAAALWHLLDSREIDTALTKGKHVGDFRYLEEIAQSWCEGWQVERTKTEQIEHIKIDLYHAASNTDLELEFADLSGETFEKAFETRLCSESFVDLVKDAAGLLLFVSANRSIDGVTILDAFGGEPLEEMLDDDQNSDGAWDPAKVPLQVRMVDLLQALQFQPFAKRPFRIAAIVSAWDLTDETSADEWLRKRMPLLAQYVASAQGAAAVRVYGVSAQGGQLPKKGEDQGQDRERLLALGTASNRIGIVGKDVRDHDLTAPLLWLSGLDDNS